MRQARTTPEPGPRRQRLPDAARLYGRLARLAGRPAPGDGRMILDLRSHGRREGRSPALSASSSSPTARASRRFPLSGRDSTRSHPTASLDTRRATLTRRRYPGDRAHRRAGRRMVFRPREGGSGSTTRCAERAIVPSDTHIHLPAASQPGWIYELVYEAKDPLVLGLGHVARARFRQLPEIRGARTRGTRQPPARRSTGIEKAYGWGRSQTGRCIRDFVYRGFNADAAAGAFSTACCRTSPAPGGCG